MINNIITYNVGFGDCTLICGTSKCGDSGKMLVDFGGDLLNIQNVATNIIQQLNSAKHKYLIISHFHQDHYNGLDLLVGKVVFDRIYIPDFINNNSLHILSAALFVKNTKIFSQAKDILTIISDLLNKGLVKKIEDIQLCKAGDEIINELEKFKCLLPKTNIICKRQITMDKIRKDFNIKSIVRALNCNDYNISGYIKEIETIKNSNFDDKDFRYIKNLFKKIQNNYSIVFQNSRINDNEKYHDSNKNILFCGDALPKNINSVKSCLYDEYDVIKIPHHGTKKYFYKDFPCSKNFIISNGKKNNNTKISLLYDTNYRQNQKFICSNKECELITKQCTCVSKKKNNAICGFTVSYKI